MIAIDLDESNFVQIPAPALMNAFVYAIALQRVIAYVNNNCKSKLTAFEILS